MYYQHLENQTTLESNLKIGTFSICHNTASLEHRELFALADSEQVVLLNEIKKIYGIVECLVLSTCNRTEIMFVCRDSSIRGNCILSKLFELKEIPYTKEWIALFRLYTYQDAVVHFLRLCCGLESAIIGEKQILGQIKKGYHLCLGAGALGPNLNILVNIGIKAGKLSRTKTAIDKGGVSVSWAVLKASESVFGNLDQKKVLLIGAGHTGQLVVNHIRRRYHCDIFLMNRTQSKAEKLASKVQGTFLPLNKLTEHMPDLDVCICCVSNAKEYVLNMEHFEKVLSRPKDRPLLLLDLAIPRNVDSEVSSIECVSYFNMDELNVLLSETIESRKKHIPEVELIVDSRRRLFNNRIKQASEYHKSTVFINKQTLEYGLKGLFFQKLAIVHRLEKSGCI